MIINCQIQDQWGWNRKWFSERFYSRPVWIFTCSRENSPNRDDDVGFSFTNVSVTCFFLLLPVWTWTLNPFSSFLWVGYWTSFSCSYLVLVLSVVGCVMCVVVFHTETRPEFSFWFKNKNSFYSHSEFSDWSSETCQRRCSSELQLQHCWSFTWGFHRPLEGRTRTRLTGHQEESLWYKKPAPEVHRSSGKFLWSLQGKLLHRPEGPAAVRQWTVPLQSTVTCPLPPGNQTDCLRFVSLTHSSGSSWFKCWTHHNHIKMCRTTCL